jgi:ribosomal protein L37AE/L43A
MRRLIYPCWNAELPRLGKKDILLFLSFVLYLLGIAEKLLNLGLLQRLYSVVSETAVFYFLILFGTAFLVTYIAATLRERAARHGHFVSVGQNRPSPLEISESLDGIDYGVRWRLHIYGSGFRKNQIWADGPYCPKCYRELEETKAGLVVKNLFWICPNCGKEFPRPNGDVKDMVEKDFEANLRRNGEL